MTAIKIYQNYHDRSGLADLYHVPSPRDALAGVAASLTKDDRLRDISFVVEDYADSGAALYCYGDFSAEEKERLHKLSHHLKTVDMKARFVDYGEAERLAGVLGDKLISRYGMGEVRKFQYCPVPRGGFIVLGFLAYRLGLNHSFFFEGPGDEGAPLVLVDDVIISGIRINQYRDRMPGRELIAATLFAPREVCEKSQRGEIPWDIVSAVETEDMARELHGDRYGEWLGEWEKRKGEFSLWVGEPEFVAFSWNEPESSFVNDLTGKTELGFKILPPRLFLNNLPGDRSPLMPEVHGAGPGPYRLSPRASYHGAGSGKVALALFGGGDSSDLSGIFLLEDTGADMFFALIKRGSPEGARDELAPLYDVDGEELRKDLDAFAESLVEKGFLQREDNLEA